MNLGGRPPLFTTPEELQQKIQEYFQSIKGHTLDPDGEHGELLPREPATITGLSYFLGFESRQSFYDYEKKDGFTYTIRKSRLRIENEYEKRLFESSPTGAIFALKNLGWSDKTEHDLTSGGLPISFNGIKMIKPDDPDAGVHPPTEL